MICAKCGKDVPGGFDFCMNCGASKEEMLQISTGRKKDELPDIGVSANNSSAQKTLRKKISKKAVMIGTIIICSVAAVLVLSFTFMHLAASKKGGAENVTLFNEGLVPFRDGDLCGYLNKKGKIVIPAQFDYAGNFSEGLACVGSGKGENRQYGYINNKGKYVINLQFDTAFPFHDGYAEVVSGDYAGFIDKKGSYVINPQYDSEGIVYIGHDMFLIDDPSGEHSYLCRKNGEHVNETRYAAVDDLLEETFNGGGFLVKSSYISSGYIEETTDDEITVYDQMLALMFGGYEWKMLPLQTIGEKYGYIDKKGEMVINAQFDSAGYFSESLARIGLYNGKTIKYGFINEKGEQVINPQFDYAENFSEGLACIAMRTKDDANDWYYIRDFGYINKKGSYVIDRKYSYASDFKNGAAIAVESNYKKSLFGLIDKKGNMITQFEYDGLTFGSSDKLLRYSMDEKYGYVKINGTVAVPAAYSTATVMYADGYAVVKSENGKYAVINESGKKVSGEFDGIYTINMSRESELKTANRKAKTAYNAIAEYLADNETKGRKITIEGGYDLSKDYEGSETGQEVYDALKSAFTDDTDCFVYVHCDLDAFDDDYGYFFVQWCSKNNPDIIGQYPNAISFENIYEPVFGEYYSGE